MLVIERNIKPLNTHPFAAPVGGSFLCTFDALLQTGETMAIPSRIRHREVLSAGGGSSIFISGWKDIATYLNKGVRTVQRYEREIGLPIHRPSAKFPGSVIATKTELDNWVT